jgi:hypothetical protein
MMLINLGDKTLSAVDYYLIGLFVELTILLFLGFILLIDKMVGWCFSD